MFFNQIHCIQIDKVHFQMKVIFEYKDPTGLNLVLELALRDINNSQYNSMMFYKKNTVQLLHIDCTHTLFSNRKLDYTLVLGLVFS